MQIMLVLGIFLKATEAQMFTLIVCGALLGSKMMSIGFLLENWDEKRQGKFGSSKLLLL